MNLKSIFCPWKKLSRDIHRELSFLFAGVVLVYAVSGIALNHKKDFNSDYIIRLETYTAEGAFPKAKQDFNKEYAVSLLEPLGEAQNYTKHYFPDAGHMKVFIKGGSSLVVNMTSGQATYESVKKRPVLHALNRLHYNPGRWWTVFSDVFAVSLIVITVSGVVMLKGRKGLWGRGGIEMLIGIAIPILFLLLS